MFGLNLIGPKDNTSSKCWQVLLPLQHGWPGSIVSYSAQIFDRPLCFWGFGHDNISIANRCRQEKHKWLFADMPYFQRTRAALLFSKEGNLRSKTKDAAFLL